MFSPLQQSILDECYRRREQVDRQRFAGFYGTESKVKLSDRTKIITQSLERLIDRGFLVGYGVRTPKKWFIKDVRITRVGVKQWEKFLERKQKRLPL